MIILIFHKMIFFMLILVRFSSPASDGLIFSEAKNRPSSGMGERLKTISSHVRRAVFYEVKSARDSKFIMYYKLNLKIINFNKYLIKDFEKY